MKISIKKDCGKEVSIELEESRREAMFNAFLRHPAFARVTERTQWISAYFYECMKISDV